MPFDEETVRAVWAKGLITAEGDPELWRKDEYGAWIRWDAYRDRGSQFGSEIDYVDPKSDGARDDLSNQRPQQWRNQTSRRMGRLAGSVTAQGWFNF